MKNLVVKIKELLVNDNCDYSRHCCIKLLFTIVTATDNLNQNTLVECLMVNNLFDSFKKLLSDPTARQEYGRDIVVLLTLLVNYRKNEGANPYVVQLSLLDEELALHGFGQIISASLFEFIRQPTINNIPGQANSWITSISSMVGNMFLSDETDERMHHIRQNIALLLALYEAVHLNRNFITTLATTQAESSSPPSPSSTLSGHHTTKELATAPLMDITHYPTNLLVAVFQYCSVAMMDHKNESSFYNLKLCFIILTCISEDQYANSMMHDSNLAFKVHLQRTHMRHRKLISDRILKPQPLAATLLVKPSENSIAAVDAQWGVDHNRISQILAHGISDATTGRPTFLTQQVNDRHPERLQHSNTATSTTPPTDVVPLIPLTQQNRAGSSNDDNDSSDGSRAEPTILTQQ
ncbi:armadillo-like helical domain-containing protein 3 [Wyeomyia smithii]|uniref:armadillo-like helical domain-containing protein 3 n=1 Tax=Wyeomyia smithii TaxID=174621 RepID=UPI002467AC38|nr:armadillo-like helical domain-containing protein 3 [Wyeomyia smithii]